MVSLCNVNFFSSKTAAARYAKGRPNVQAAAIRTFREFAKITRPFKKCLDVGCGTGLSSVAVAEICESVIGADISEGMLAHTAKHPKIQYQKCDAVNLPFADNSFDLITVGLAMHWFDQPAFLKEARRVLGPGGWLVIYNNEFKNEMKGVPAFTNWFENSYLVRYPNPQRKNELAFNEKLAGDGFEFLSKGEFTNDIEMNQEQFVAYLESQSNIIAKVEQGSERIENVEKWLFDSTREFFENINSGTLLFTGGIWYLRKVNKKQRTLARY